MHELNQQLRTSAPAHNSLQNGYRMKEILERSPTLPRTPKTTVGNNGKSPDKLTVNSTRVRRTEVDNRENISLNVASKRCVSTYVNDVAQTQQLVANPSSGFLSANQKRRHTTYVIQTLALAQNNQTQATIELTIVDICSQLDNQTTHMRTNLSQLVPDATPQNGVVSNLSKRYRFALNKRDKAAAGYKHATRLH
ncbi:poly (ADP-ribose) polymerase family protein [Dorcoceras hygrometricum]|uniref:Poly (ADP-ribose) polymerase family protein n=1 Tax=Dorcoceras hygrometricum TaxID=472368 RepID=A0A2Z7CHA5_9LAMI|nr:poly (ADP-ribose) polymerase family protein [Dorcoceras hygrometricum]